MSTEIRNFHTERKLLKALILNFNVLQHISNIKDFHVNNYI